MSIVLDGTTGITTPGLTNTGTETIVNLTTTGNTILGDASTDTLNVGNGGLVKDASGNVGIGTASPQNLLNVVKNSANSSAAANAGIALQSDSGATYTAGLHFGTDKTGVLSYIQSDSSASYSTVPLVLNPLGGNVGIGTSSPTQKLQVSGNVRGTAFYVDGGAYLGTAGSDTLTFIAGSSERMRIESGGFVGIGTDASGTAPLTVGRAASNGNLGQICARGLAAGDAGSAGMSVSKYDATTTTSQIFFKFIIGQGSAGSGQINANGANTAAFGSYSDSRLKENIVDLPSQLDNIMALRPVEYDYIESMGGGHQIGFVAQEVQAIYPDLVGEGSDGMLTLTDMNKNDARLIKAIQEMKAIIDTQASTITQLQADVAALKGTP